MADYEISFSDVRDLEKAISQGMDLTPIKDVIKKDTAFMAKEIANNTPVDTGFMKREETVSVEDAGLTGKVTGAAEYTGYQEYGTRFIYGRFFFKHGSEKAGELFYKDLEALMR